MLDRPIPSAVEVEERIIVAILLDNRKLPEVLEIIEPDDMYRSANRVILKAMSDMHTDGIFVDAATLYQRICDSGNSEVIGGAQYLSNLIDNVALSVDIEAHCRIVRQKADLRRAIEACYWGVNQCYCDPYGAISQIQARMLDIGSGVGDSSLCLISATVDEALTRYEDLKRSDGDISGVSTGFRNFDKTTAGLQPSDLVVLAARPSMGKTALAVAIARNAARNGTPVAVYSMEMSRHQITDRLVAIQTNLDLMKFKNGNFVGDEWRMMSDAAETIQRLQIYTDDRAALHYRELCRSARQAHNRHGIGLVIIDYLQLMRGDNPRDRNLELESITGALKGLAKELNIPVLLLSQLNRKLEDRHDRRPQLSDLRQSGAIEQDADIVAFLYRGAYYDEAGYPPNAAELIIKKHRNGPTRTLVLEFTQHSASYKNATDPQIDSWIRRQSG